MTDESELRDRPDQWMTTWVTSPVTGRGFAPLPYADGFSNQTARQVVRSLSIGGTAVRVRLSNVFGTQPISFATATVGTPGNPGRLSPAAPLSLSFRGRPDVTLAPGQEVLSDPVPIKTHDQQKLVVSLFTKGATGVPTFGIRGLASYVADGDMTAAENDDRFVEASPIGYFLTGVDVLAAPRARGTIAALGDSITALGWPGHLAPRLLDQFSTNPLGVVNAGIAGNRVLRDGRRSANRQLETEPDLGGEVPTSLA